MDERNRFPSAIVKHLLIPDWLCILLLVFAGYFAHTSSRLQIDLEENQKNSIAKLHAMEADGLVPVGSWWTSGAPAGLRALWQA